jgi:hypothetical protein
VSTRLATKLGQRTANSAACEVAGDRGQLVLLAHAFLVACEAERREAADDDEEYRDGPHRVRIGTAPDGLDRGIAGDAPVRKAG